MPNKIKWRLHDDKDTAIAAAAAGTTTALKARKSQDVGQDATGFTA
jgi:hypothetical protein